MSYSLDAEARDEFLRHLTRIQEACREYVTQDASARRMTFASIRIAADSIATHADDVLPTGVANDVRDSVNDLRAAVDELTGRFGSTEAGKCAACGYPLQRTPLGGGAELLICPRCPSDMLEAVRQISDLTGADTL